MSNLPPNWPANRPNAARNYSLGTTCYKNNAVANYTGSTARDRWRAMPQKFSPSAGDSLFSLNRSVYTRVEVKSDQTNERVTARQQNNPKPVQYMDASQRIAIKRQRAIGNATIPKTTTTSLSFTDTSQDNRDPNLIKNRTVGNVIRRAQRRARSGGSVAPKKKGAIDANTN